MNIIGRQIEVGIGLETTRGTATASSKWYKKMVASVLPKFEKKIDESTFGVLEDSQGARIVKKSYEGTIEGIAHADVIGYFFMNLFGADDVTPNVTSYVHAFSLEQSVQHASLSIYRKEADLASEVFAGGVVSEMKISATTDDYVKFSAKMILSTEASSSETPSYDDEFDFIGRDVNIRIATTAEGLPDTTPIKVKSADIIIKGGGVADYILGSYNPDTYNSAFGMEIELKKHYEDTTFEDLYRSNDYIYMQIDIVSENEVEEGTDAQLSFTLNRVQVQEWERSGNANDLVDETVKIKTFYNAEDEAMATATLVNNTASYTLGS